MKKQILFFGLLFLVASCQAQKQKADEYVDEDLSMFVPKGYTIEYSSAADLNGDSLLDRLLVLEVDPDLDSIALAKLFDTSVDVTLRPVIVLVRQKNGQLKQVKRNDHVIPYAAMWVMSFDNRIDPLVYAYGSTGGFKFGFQSHGGGNNCTEDVEFYYNKKERNWVLGLVSYMCVDYNDPTEQYIPKELGHRTAKDFGTVLFTDYTYEKEY